MNEWDLREEKMESSWWKVEVVRSLVWEPEKMSNWTLTEEYVCYCLI